MRQKDKTVKISIVMPVYNTGDFLEEAIESLLKQTFHDFQLICVDDGSDDLRTKEILEKYSLYPQVEIVHQAKKCGAGEARNIGFRNAYGKYVIFLDADDIFDGHMLEIMYKRISEDNADVCICGSEWFYPNGERVKKIPILPKKGTEDWLISLSFVPWDKLVKRDYLLKNNIQFQNLSSSNDVYYSLSLYLNSEKIISCGDELLVQYRCGQKNQISAKRDPRNIYIVCKKAWEIYKGKMGLDISALSLLLIIGMINELNRCNNDEWKKECYIRVVRFIKKHQSDISYKNKLYCFYIDSLLKMSYETGWYKDAFSFTTKLRVAFPEIYEKMKDKENVVLWGLGERGRAFVQVCKENDFKILYITDRRYNEEDFNKYEGIRVIDGNDALERADGIIASNHEIAEYIYRSQQKICVCDLENYC